MMPTIRATPATAHEMKKEKSNPAFRSEFVPPIAYNPLDEPPVHPIAPTFKPTEKQSIGQCVFHFKGKQRFIKPSQFFLF